jgi:hypothetical protein
VRFHPGLAEYVTTLLAIDPGLRELGAAFFRDGVLRRAWLVKNPERKARGLPAWMAIALELQDTTLERTDQLPALFVSEYPQSYVAKFQKGDQGDLIELSGVVGACAGALGYSKGEVTSYLPAQWKKTVPKPIHNQRVINKLSPEELSAIDSVPESLKHNVLDAIGIGLFKLGRMK